MNFEELKSGLLNCLLLEVHGLVWDLGIEQQYLVSATSLVTIHCIYFREIPWKIVSHTYGETIIGKKISTIFMLCILSSTLDKKDI